jgi:diguanylate cyclase (GGDEF)-like protein
MEEHGVSFMAAAFDALTGLPNRFLFEDRLNQVLVMSNRAGRRFAVHMLNLENSGPEAALRTIGERFDAAVRESDTVARFGPKEFAALQPEIEDEEDARDMSERLIRALYAPVVVGSESFQISASIGIALFPSDGEDAPALIAAAQRALERAKARVR